MSAEFLVNTYTTGNQNTFLPGTPQVPATQSIGMDDNGNFVIAWSSQNQDGESWGVYAQRFNPDGSPNGTEFKVNTVTAGAQYLPSVSMANASGEFVITWTSVNQDGNLSGVYGQRYTADGQPNGNEFQVNTTTNGEQRYSAVAMDADGDLVVTWTSSANDGTGEGIVARRYDKAKNEWGNEFTVNTTTPGDQEFSSIAMEDNGDYVITWSSGNDASSEVYAQRFSADGTRIGSEFRVNTNTANLQGEPTIAMDADGDFVISWTDNGQDGNSYGVYAQRYNSSGLAVGGEFKVNTYIVGQQRRPNAAMDADGDFVVTWTSIGQDGGVAGVYAQRFDANGNRQGDEFRLNDETAGNQHFSPVAMDKTGNFVSAWTSNGQDGSGNGVYAKQVAGIINTPPTVGNIDKSGTEDLPIPLALANFNAVFTDVESNNNLNRIKIAALPGNGKLQLNGVDVILDQEIAAIALDTLVYLPNENFSGTDSFSWNGSDGIVYAASNALVTLTLAPINDPPGIGVVNKAGTEEVTATFTVEDFISGFNDVDNDLLQEVTIASLPTSGTLFLGGTAVIINQKIAAASLPSLTFTPATNFSGTTSFEWNGFDGNTYGTANGTVNINITGVNDAPLVEAVNKTQQENTPIQFAIADFQSAFKDLDGDLLNKIQITSLPANGTLLLGSNPVTLNREISRDELATLTFTPTNNFNGVVSFGWNGSDGLLYAPATNVVNLTITPVNAAPTISPVAKIGNEDAPLVFAASDFQGAFSDSDLEPLTKVRISTLPTNGVLLLGNVPVTVGEEIAVANLGNLSFAPEANFNGAVSFSWNGSDGAFYAAQDAAVNLTINAVNDAPTVGNISKVTNENTAIAFTTADFAGVFSDIDGQLLQKIQIVTLPANGTLVLGSTAVTANQEITAAELETLTFAPAASFNGIINFTWTGSDGAAYAGTPATVSISVGSINDPPTLTPFIKIGAEDDPAIAFAADDFITAFKDIDNDSLNRIQITTLPTNGTLFLSDTAVTANQEIVVANLGNLTFVPAANFSGSTSFGWNASDGNLYALTPTTATINVTPVNDIPTVSNVSKSGSENIPIAFTVTDFAGAFKDIDSDALNKIQITSLPDAARGILTLNGTAVAVNEEIAANQLANLVFTPAATVNGPVSFGWNGSDGTAYATASGTVNITIDAVNDAPTVTNINKASAEDSPVVFTLSDFTGAFADVDGNTLNKIRVTSLPTNGILRLDGVDVTLNQEIAASALDKLTFTPANNFNGTISFNWNGSDSLLYATTEAAVNLTINAIDDAPVISAVSKAGIEDTPIPFLLSDFTQAFTDVENSPLSKIQITALSLNGTLLLNGTAVALNDEITAVNLANLTFAPAANFNGNTSFGWVGSDGASYATIPSTVNLAIAPANDIPTVSTVSRSTDEGTSITFTANDFATAFNDPDIADRLVSVRITSVPTNGTLFLNNVAVTANQEIAVAQLGSLTFTPNPNFNGIVTFGWNGSDGTSYSATDGTVNLTINPVNTTPTVLAIAKTGDEDGAIAFTAGDFAAAFSDVDKDLLNKIRIVTLPANGILKLGGADVTAGQEIAVAQLDTLIFTPTINFNGNTSFEWNGSDGTLYAATGAAVNLAIAPINDPPVVGNVGKTGNEGAVIAFAATDFIDTFNDLDAQPLVAVQITSLPTNGTLRLNDLEVTLNQEIAPDALNTLTFTPAPTFNGKVSFSWNGSDGQTYAASPAIVDITINPVNTAPTVSVVTVAGTEDSPLTFTEANFVAGFNDVDGDVLNKIRITSLPTGGVLTLGGTAVTVDQEITAAQLGTLTFTPNANVNGTVSFGWNASDGLLYGTGATVEVAIAPANDPPTVANVSKAGDESTAIAFTLADFAGAFSDIDTDTLNKIQITSLPTNGVLKLGDTDVTLNQEITVAQIGTLTFTPNPTFNGAVSFNWNGSDGITYAAAGAVVNLTINPVNTAPTVTGISKTINEDAAIAFTASDFTGAFTDVDGDLLNKIRIASLPGNGTLALGNTAVTVGLEIAVAELNTLVFTPNANFNGTVSFGWNGSDSALYAATDAAVNITITGISDTPVANPISKTGTEDVPVALAATDFISAFTDPDGGSLSKIQITALPASGILQLGGANVTLNQEIAVAALDTLTFTPAANVNGSISFGWNGSNGTAYAATPTAVTLELAPANDLPTVANISKSANEDVAIAFTTSDFANAFADIDGNILNKILITSLPANGTLQLGSTTVALNQEITAAELAALTFTPAATFNGNVSFSWNGSDGIAYAATGAAVNLTFNPVNNAPTAGTITKTTNEDVAIAFTTADFVGAFSDVDGNALNKIRITALPTNGTLALNGTAVTLDQEVAAASLNGLTFTPSANFNGAASFGWNASDGILYAISAGVVNLTINPINDAPAIAPVNKAGNEDAVVAFTATDFIAAFTDADGNNLTNVRFTSLPANGTLRLDGAVVALNQEIAVAALNTLTFTPSANANGTISFGWNGSDGTAYATAGGAVNINLAPANDLPTVSNVSKTAGEDAVITFAASDFAASFTDIDADPLSKIQVASLPTNGVLALDGTAVTLNQEIAAADLSKLTFTPTANFNGAVSFSWNGSDGTAYAAAGAVVNLTITAANDAPIVGAIAKTGTEDGSPILFTANDFTAAFSDTENSPLAKIRITSLAANGTVLLNGVAVTLNQEIATANLGTLSFIPNPNANGTLSFGWNGSDGELYATTPGAVNLTVAPVNDVPAVSNISKTANENTTITFAASDFAGAFSDIDSDALSKIQITSLPANGVLTLNGTNVTLNQEIAAANLGSLTFTPNANFSGAVNFGWNGSDGTTYASGGAAVNLTINAVNDPPVVSSFSGAGNEDTSITFTSTAFTAAFNDIDGNSLNKIRITALPANGSLKLNGEAIALNQEVAVTALNNLTFVPNANFSGTDSFGWNGSDGELYAAANAVVNLTINQIADAPAIATTDSPLAYAEGAGPVAIDGGITVVDPDSPRMSGSTVVITNFDPTQDSLGFVPQNGITGTINGGTLTLSGLANLEDYLTVLRSVTYTNTSPSPDTTPRTVQVTVTDDTNAISNVANRTIQIIPDASSPVLTPSNGTLQYSENSGAAIVDREVSLSDSDSVLLSSATAAIVGYVPNSQETLSLNAQNGITGSFNPETGVLTLVGLSALANYQSALRSVTYTNDSDSPNPTARTVQFRVTDESLGSSSTSRQIQISPVNDAPVVVPPRGTIPYSKNQGTIVLDGTITVTDPDSSTLTGATATVVNYLPGQGGLGFVNQNNISGSFDDNTGVLTLRGTSSVSNYQAALRSITFVHNNATPTTLPQFVQFAVSDGALTSDATIGTLQVVFENTPPVLDLNGAGEGIDFAATGSASGGSVKAVSDALTLTDIDGSVISSATIAIANPISGVQERLSADTTGTDISASYNPDLGILSLAGTASIEAYQQVLRTVTYSSAFVDSQAPVRTVTFTAQDGEKNSATATATLSLVGAGGSGQEMGISLVTTPIQDVINALDSNDTVTSTLANVQQNDLVNGGAGVDTFVLADGTGTAFVTVANSTNQITGIVPTETTIANFERFNFGGFRGNVMMTGSDGLDDVLTGGSGNDALVGGGGNDTLISNAGNDVMSDSSGNDILDGGAGRDRLNSGAGDDTILGGAGRDELRGGRGKDRFHLDARKGSMDVIADFRAADDTFVISKSVAGKSLKIGAIKASQFILGNGACDRSDRFIYNRSTGTLFFDADGLGGTAQIQIARLSNKAALTQADIVVIA